MIEPDLDRFYMTWWAAERAVKSPHHVEWIDVEIIE